MHKGVGAYSKKLILLVLAAFLLFSAGQSVAQKVSFTPETDRVGNLAPGTDANGSFDTEKSDTDNLEARGGMDAQGKGVGGLDEKSGGFAGTNSSKARLVGGGFGLLSGNFGLPGRAALAQGGGSGGGLPDDDCPQVSCSGQSTNSVGGSGGGSTQDVTPGQDNRYKDMQIQGPMGAADNSRYVNPSEWFDTKDGRYDITPPTPPSDGSDPYKCQSLSGPGNIGSVWACPLDPGTQGSMPNGPMKNKSTPAMALIKFFPWLYKDIDSLVANSADCSESDSEWNCSSSATSQPQFDPQYNLYRGTGNNAYSDVDSPVQSGATKASDAADYDDQIFASQTNTQASGNAATVDISALDKQKCQAVTNSCGDPDPDTLQVWTRLQYDSCTNQVILPLAYYPSFIFSQTRREHQYPYNETLCQALKMQAVPCAPLWFGSCKSGSFPETQSASQYDYDVTYYLNKAWNGVLHSSYVPNVGKNTGDAGEPPYASCSGSNCIGAPGSGTGGTPYPAASTSNPNLTPHDLSNEPFERIFDPTHPYSPRWDFSGTDRDMSSMAALTGGTSLGTPGWGYDQRVSYGAITCIVRCASVPVDVLSFRSAEFQSCMGCRIQTNTQCFWEQVYLQLIPIDIDPYYEYDGLDEMMSDSYTDTLDNSYVVSGDPWLFNDTPLQCKTYYDNQGEWPLCSTKFDYPQDLAPSQCTQCDDDAGSDDQNVSKCCNDLAQALAPLNVLKIRNTKEDPELLPLPEGYAFNQYFGNHMPYMRWWDAGTAAHGSGGNSLNYNPWCDEGQYDTVLGVGIEGKSCKYGGGDGESYNNNCVTVPTFDAMTSWAELKQYQLNTFRNYGLNCLAQYEKIYKPNSAEDGALFAVGGYYNSGFPQNIQVNSDGAGNVSYTVSNLEDCPQGTSGTTCTVGTVTTSEQKVNPWPLGWRGYLSDLNQPDRFPQFGAGASTSGALISGGLDNAKVGDIIFFNHTDTASNGGVYLPNSPYYPTPPQIMPFMAVVTGVFRDPNALDSSGNIIQNKSCSNYVEVVDFNNGKNPDVCGNTNYIGMGQTRRIYKDWLPTNVWDSLYELGYSVATSSGGESNSCNDSYTVGDDCYFPDPANPDSYLLTPGCLDKIPQGTGFTGLILTNDGNCIDPKMSSCTYGQDVNGNLIWSQIEVYRPTSDLRN